jgi:hypothetical protein
VVTGKPLNVEIQYNKIQNWITYLSIRNQAAAKPQYY